MFPKAIEALECIEKKVSDIMFEKAKGVDPKSEEEREAMDRKLTEDCVELIINELSSIDTELKTEMLVMMLKAHFVTAVNKMMELEHLKNSGKNILDILNNIQDVECPCSSCVEKRANAARVREENESKEDQDEADK